MEVTWKPVLFNYEGPDVRWENHGSIQLARLLTPEALQWAHEHCPDATRWGQALVVEPRYGRDLSARMDEDGLTQN